VRERIDAALDALEASPDGWLELPERRRLREAYGPWTPPYEGGPDPGLLRRAALAVACAKRALPAWEETFPGDRRPHGIVEAVMPGIQRERPEEDLLAAKAALRGDVDRLGTDLERKEAFFAGLAALLVVSEAWDGDLDPEIYPPETRDLDLDEPPVDALAAWALAGEDPEARRAYWHWYVTDAFPAAYAVAA
jgi:hypothetical protein